MYEDLKYWYLRDHQLFRTLNSKEIKQLCIIGKFKKAKKEDIIYFSDTDVPRIFFLKKGAIKITRINEDGEEIIKDIIQKGDLFGELDMQPDLKSVEIAKAASSEVIICSFLLSDFEQLMLSNPQLALNYSKLVGFKLKRFKNSYNNLVSKDVKHRFKLFLLEWLERDAIKTNNEYKIENYLTQNDIAQIICTSRQTATALINNAENLEIISYSRKEIIVKDLEKLKNL